MRPAVEDRREHHDVVQMHAALIGVVGDKLIARLEIVLAVAIHRRADDDVHRRDMAGLCRRLPDHPAMPVEQGAGQIEPGLDVRGVGGASQSHAHLVGRCLQRPSDHFKADRDPSSASLANRVLTLAVSGGIAIR